MTRRMGPSRTGKELAKVFRELAKKHTEVSSTAETPFMGLLLRETEDQFESMSVGEIANWIAAQVMDEPGGLAVVAALRKIDARLDGLETRMGDAE